MSLTSYDNIINAISANAAFDSFDFFKIGAAGAQAAGKWYSLYASNGMPGPGAYGTGARNAVAGSLNFANVSPSVRSLLTLGAMATQNCTLLVYDRLVEVSGLSLTTTGSISVSTAALPRFTNGVGVQAWVEITTATTTTAAVFYLNSYTNSAGTSGQNAGSSNAITLPAAATPVAYMAPFPLVAGDLGVRAISTFDVSTAASAGACSIILMKPLAYIPLVQYQWTERDFVLQLPGLETIPDGHSICFALLAQTTTATTVYGKWRSAYG